MAGAEFNGRRCLLRLGDGKTCVNLVVPLNRDVPKAAVLVLMEHRALCGALAAQWFALRHKLTLLKPR